MTPLVLDTILNGVKVYIYRHQDGSIYPTIHNFERFGVKSLQTVRVPVTLTSTLESVLAHESIQKAIKRLSN